MKKILVIEDNADVRENLSEILELSNYEVITAENGISGVEKAQNDLPDLILCDVMMPELDGFGVLHILSKKPKTADIPFIFLTAKTEKEDFRKGMTLGADDYISKPFDDVLLLQTIETRLRKAERRKTETSPFFTSIQNEEQAKQLLSGLSKEREMRTYLKKDPIFKEGEIPRWLFFIESGQVKLSKTHEDGRELIVKISKTGDFLGYLALLQNDNYTENATALEDCRIRLIPREEFQNLVFGNREVTANFVRLLANNVSEREEQSLNLAYSSVRRRVALALVYLHNQGNKNITMLREDLAALAGTAKETLIRTLTDFKNEGLIEVNEGSISLKKVEKLAEMRN